MTTKLTVGIVSRTFFNVSYWAAIERGYFSNEGIEVETIIYGNRSQVPLLLGGDLNIVIGTPEAAIENAVSGGTLRIIGGNTGKLTHSLIARGRFERVEDLRGATIGILNMTEGTFFQIKEMLSKHGLSYPRDYRVKETGGVPPRHKALIDGTIDAGLQSIPWSYVAEEVGLRNLGSIVDYIPDWQFVSINTDTRWARSNRSTVVGFLRAMIRGTEWVFRNKQGAAEIAARELPTPLKYAERAWEYYTETNAITRDVSISQPGLAKVIDVLIAERILPEAASRDPGAYVEPDYLREARRLSQ
ncbi:ABC transporter substrate-binding protein [Pseudorhodoplanes sinuspersici]|nr:ABC transporter substrate-binding protein [Pseudorhodoplanes sinuspersici]RKE68225.1 ABC-type nitrate/sulfonate/bicarbonate transport system substrate-binding protein [Pseudorhodoplanes sinuspersici]